VAALYAFAGKLCLAIAIVHPSASAVWAPTGLAIAALLRLGYWVAPGIFVGAFIVNFTTYGSVLSSLGIAAGNTLEAMAAAYLVRRFANGRHAFERAGDTVRFALLAGVLSTAVSATIGVTSLASQGFARWEDFGRIWITWWLGDLGGALVFAPLLLVWMEKPHVQWSRAQMLEAVALMLSLVAVGQIAFGWRATAGQNGQPLAFLCMPPLMWAAFRFDSRITSTAILLLAVMAVTGTLNHTVPVERWELNQALVILQVFLGLAAVTMLTFSAVVAERSRAASAAEAASEELRSAMAELEAFNHAISHDLRSPLGAVILFSEAIEMDLNGSPSVEIVQRIRSSAKAASDLLEELSRVAWTGERPERHTVDMTSLAHDVHAELVTGGTEGAEVHFDFRELPSAWGSEALLRCLLRNLFSNAIKYTRGRSERRVQVTGIAGEQENIYYVTDNGVGFDPMYGESVFQPYRRLSHTAGFEGSGLGLAIAARIVRRHGGRIWGESDGVSGARFCFALPRSSADA
jgi:signal transduction histidine kinase